MFSFRGRVGPLLAVALFALGCSDDTTPEPGAPGCAFTGDGVCDEPINCALGTDEADCVAACGSGVDLHRHAAACAHRSPPQEPPDDGLSSGGSLHLTGHRDGFIEVPSGEDPSRIVKRKYRLYVPEAYHPERTHPLLVVMAGHRVSFDTNAGNTQIERTADLNRFIVVYADQEWRQTGEKRWAWWTDWNWSLFGPESHPDLIYLRALVDRLGTEYNVDRRRVFASGHSRGAAMAFIAAIEASDVFAGACIQSGFTEFGYLDARLTSHEGRKAAMYFFHGAADPDVPVSRADEMVERLTSLGWAEPDDVVYHRLDGITHRWQPWMNQSFFDYLYDRPLPEGTP